MAALENLVDGIGFLAGYKDNFDFMQVGEPTVIRVSAVLNHNRTFGQAQTAGHLGLMGFPIGNGHKCRQIAGMIQQGVQFDRLLGSAEGGPGECLKRKVDDRGIQAIEVVFEFEFMFGRYLAATLIGLFKQGFIERGRAHIVGVGKSGRARGSAPRWYRLLTLEFMERIPSRKLTLPVSCINWLQRLKDRDFRPVPRAFSRV